MEAGRTGTHAHPASRPEQVEELARRHDADALVLPERQQAMVSRDDERRATLERGGNKLIVVRILADGGGRSLAGDEIGQHSDVLEPELGLEVATDELADLRVREGTQHFVCNGG